MNIFIYTNVIFFSKWTLYWPIFKLFWNSQRPRVTSAFLGLASIIPHAFWSTRSCSAKELFIMLLISSENYLVARLLPSLACLCFSYRFHTRRRRVLLCYINIATAPFYSSCNTLIIQLLNKKNEPHLKHIHCENWSVAFQNGCFLSQNYLNFCVRDREEFSRQKIGIF